MKCKSCNQIIPDDSSFCPLCGSSLKEMGNYSSEAFDSTDSENRTIDKKKKTIALLKVIVGILVVLVVCLGLLFEDRLKSSQSSIDELVEQNKALNEQIIRSRKRITEKSSEVADLKTTVNLYEKGLKAQTNYDVTGYASPNFHVDKDLVVVETSRKTTVELTAFWPEGGNCYHSLSSSCASVEFKQDSWSQSVTLEIQGNKKGICIVSFKNDQDNEQFNMMIVVV